MFRRGGTWRKKEVDCGQILVAIVIFVVDSGRSRIPYPSADVHKPTFPHVRQVAAGLADLNQCDLNH